MTSCVRAIVLALGLASAAANATAQSFQERLSVCLACHGEKGQSANPETPSLGGQPASYLLIQIFMFREGTRKVELMNDQAKGLTDDDLRAMSDALAKLPPPKPATEAADPARIERARQLATRHRCNVCHSADFSGQDPVPRIGAQREDYLLKSLREYKSGARLGYDPAMIEAMRGVSDDDIVDLAHYLSRRP